MYILYNILSILYLHNFSFQMFTLLPLIIVLPSKKDQNHPVIDLDLHLPFLCFKSRELLQVITVVSLLEF